ncbi:MAG TPA: aminoacyl-tRNA hydrolase [Candidatus Saccharibacteria bacterium]|nr:aminoacyl-tRNA hydrolase [Candidatus Saccharibacteria bacterium]
MKIVFGLGNPEQQYDGTRHNVGFAVLDEYAAKNGVSFQAKEKFHADIAEFTISGEKVLLVKPATYYNLVGQSLRAIADFYKVEPEDILIVHDDLALPFGTVRTRIGGSDAGNNGIKSVNQHGMEQTNRVRIGIATEQRALLGDSDFVLAKFTAEERKVLSVMQQKIAELVDDFLAGNFNHATHR